MRITVSTCWNFMIYSATFSHLRARPGWQHFMLLAFRVEGCPSNMWYGCNQKRLTDRQHLTWNWQNVDMASWEAKAVQNTEEGLTHKAYDAYFPSWGKWGSKCTILLGCREVLNSECFIALSVYWICTTMSISFTGARRYLLAQSGIDQVKPTKE